ncbi:MAG: FIST N-terminal domain-containing protein [Salegentibacter sp.]
MKAKSINGSTLAEVEEKISQSINDDFHPTLAIVFISKSMDFSAVNRLFDEKDIAVFGLTTNGEFTDENLKKSSAAILLLDIEPEYFQIYSEEFENRNYKKIAEKVAEKSKKRFDHPAFLLGISNAATDGELILRGLEAVIDKDLNAFGGAAGDDFSFSETIVFTNGFESNNGIICLILDEEKIEVKGIATCGWKAVGTEKTVTKSEGNHVYTIDNIPALDITTKYGGLENVTPKNKDLLMELAGNFPLQLQRPQGDPVMRPGLVVDWNDHSFYTSGSVPEGSKVRFSLPPDFDVMEKVVKEVEKVKLTEMPEADAVIVFSCGGRLISLGPLMTQEIEGINEVWKVPMVGMFSNAELGRATGGNLEMHNLTTCCVALKEKAR